MKKSIIILLILAIAIVVSACGGETQENSNREESFGDLSFLIPESWEKTPLEKTEEYGTVFEGNCYENGETPESVTVSRYKFDKSQYSKAVDLVDTAVENLDGASDPNDSFKKRTYSLVSKGHRTINGEKYKSAIFSLDGILKDGGEMNMEVEVVYIPHEYQLYMPTFEYVKGDIDKDQAEADKKVFYDSITFDF